MKSIRRALKCTNINNISRDTCEYSRTWKWRAHGAEADAKHFSRQYVRLNSHDSVAAIIHVAAYPPLCPPPSPPAAVFPALFRERFLRPVVRLIGKDCVSLGWPRRRSRARFIIVTLREVPRGGNSPAIPSPLTISPIPGN